MKRYHRCTIVARRTNVNFILAATVFHLAIDFYILACTGVTVYFIPPNFYPGG